MKIPQRFLLIDDDPFNNRLCQMALKRVFKDPDVISFTEPETGLDYIENEYAKNPVDTILFLDLNMPSLTGWEVLEKLEDSNNEIKDHLRIYILSSSIDPVDKQKADENPIVSGYMEKPLLQAQLQKMFSDNLLNT